MALGRSRPIERPPRLVGRVPPSQIKSLQKIRDVQTPLDELGLRAHTEERPLRYQSNGGGWAVLTSAFHRRSGGRGANKGRRRMQGFRLVGAILATLLVLGCGIALAQGDTASDAIDPALSAPPQA